MRSPSPAPQVDGLSPTPRDKHAAIVHGTRMLVFGGWGPLAGLPEGAEAPDPTNTFSGIGWCGGTRMFSDGSASGAAWACHL